MVTRDLIEQFAIDYLIKNEYPIVTSSGTVTLPEDEKDVESKEYLEEMGIARVSFISKYLDDPEHDLDPGVYIVYVNIITGEVYMPPHM